MNVRNWALVLAAVVALAVPSPTDTQSGPAASANLCQPGTPPDAPATTGTCQPPDRR